MILILGDTHTQWFHIGQHLEEANKLSPTPVEAIVQVGDFGVFPLEWSSFRGSPIPLYFIEGNHEDFDLLGRMAQGAQNPICLNKQNVIYVPRGTSFELGGLKWVGLGGCRKFDDNPANCPEGSIIKEEDLKKTLLQKKADILVTHDGPFGLGIPSHPDFGFKPDAGDRQLIELYRLKPKVWFFGHHHRNVQVENRGVKHYGLDRSESGFGLFDPGTFGFAWRTHPLDSIFF